MINHRVCNKSYTTEATCGAGAVRLSIYNLFVRALETGRIASLRRAFQACFAASTNEFNIYRQCTYIVFILQCKRSWYPVAMYSGGRRQV
jgi:hypothetical protein